MLNAILFMLIGIEVLVISFSVQSVLAGIIIIGIVLGARFVSVYVPISLIGIRNKVPARIVMPQKIKTISGTI